MIGIRWWRWIFWQWWKLNWQQMLLIWWFLWDTGSCILLWPQAPHINVDNSLPLLRTRTMVVCHHAQFMWCWRLNPELHGCYTKVPPFEPHLCLCRGFFYKHVQYPHFYLVWVSEISFYILPLIVTTKRPHSLGWGLWNDRVLSLWLPEKDRCLFYCQHDEDLASPGNQSDLPK